MNAKKKQRVTRWLKVYPAMGPLDAQDYASIVENRVIISKRRPKPKFVPLPVAIASPEMLYALKIVRGYISSDNNFMNAEDCATVLAAIKKATE